VGDKISKGGKPFGKRILSLHGWIRKLPIAGSFFSHGGRIFPFFFWDRFLTNTFQNRWQTMLAYVHRSSSTKDINHYAQSIFEHGLPANEQPTYQEMKYEPGVKFGSYQQTWDFEEYHQQYIDHYLTENDITFAMEDNHLSIPQIYYELWESSIDNRKNKINKTLESMNTKVFQSFATWQEHLNKTLEKAKEQFSYVQWIANDFNDEKVFEIDLEKDQLELSDSIRSYSKSVHIFRMLGFQLIDKAQKAKRWLDHRSNTKKRQEWLNLVLFNDIPDDIKFDAQGELLIEKRPDSSVLFSVLDHGLLKVPYFRNLIKKEMPKRRPKTSYYSGSTTYKKNYLKQHFFKDPQHLEHLKLFLNQPDIKLKLDEALKEYAKNYTNGINFYLEDQIRKQQCIILNILTETKTEHLIFNITEIGKPVAQGLAAFMKWSGRTFLRKTDIQRYENYKGSPSPVWDEPCINDLRNFYIIKTQFTNKNISLNQNLRKKFVQKYRSYLLPEEVERLLQVSLRDDTIFVKSYLAGDPSSWKNPWKEIPLNDIYNEVQKELNWTKNQLLALLKTLDFQYEQDEVDDEGKITGNAITFPTFSGLIEEFFNYTLGDNTGTVSREMMRTYRNLFEYYWSDLLPEPKNNEKQKSIYALQKKMFFRLLDLTSHLISQSEKLTSAQEFLLQSSQLRFQEKLQK